MRSLLLFFFSDTLIQPCNPSPCGPNSQCRTVSNQAVCSCLPTFIGSPPSCRPECSISAECPLNEACNNHKCINPCIGTCGYGARCEVINHNPICSCPNQYTGNPFSQCIPIGKSYDHFLFYCHANKLWLNEKIFNSKKYFWLYFSNLFQLPRLCRKVIHAVRHHVGHILFAKKLENHHHAHVRPIT